MEITTFDDGYVLLADSVTQATFYKVIDLVGGEVKLIVGDPPYGKIVDDDWDQTDMTEEEFVSWMMLWTRLWATILVPGGAFYVWGGIGIPNFRPFLKYTATVESQTDLEIGNLITWSKKRGYGVQNNYLFTREELLYLVRGDAKKPHCFNVPYLDEERGYAGYNAKYPAKSKFLRRTNVWRDITEILKGKRHTAHKAARVMEIPIEVHTQKGEWVVDLFAGSGATAMAARRLGRKFVVIEKNPEIYKKLVEWLNGPGPTPMDEIMDAGEK